MWSSSESGSRTWYSAATHRVLGLRRQAKPGLPAPEPVMLTTDAGMPAPLPLAA